MISPFEEYQQDLYRIIRGLKKRLRGNPENKGIAYALRLVIGLALFREKNRMELQYVEIEDEIRELLVNISEIKKEGNNSASIYGIAEIVFEHKQCTLTHHLPKPKDKIRLYSILSQDIYRDVPIDAFCEVEVNTKGLEESNHFLISLWNEMNKLLHPHQSEFVPWAYMPNVLNKGDKRLLFLGDVDSSLGNIHMMLVMDTKVNIRSIMAYNIHMKKGDCQKLFEELVNRAKMNQNTLQKYACRIHLKANMHDIRLREYGGYFYRLGTDESGCFVDIRLLAIDMIEARQSLIKRLDHLCSFLAVETNLFFEAIAPFEIELEKNPLPIITEQEYVLPFIDGPSVRDGYIMLSESGAKYLDRFVFVERDIRLDGVALAFNRSCVHIYEGLRRQLERGERLSLTTKYQNASLVPKNIPQQQNIITMAAMSYMSAVETASVQEGKAENCPTCGNVMYKISARIMNFTAKYLHSDLGRLFKELYNLRSQFLHAGKLSSESYQISARPFIDPTTGSGLIDYGFISCKVNGKLMIVGLQNIQEWTTFTLRCYYQEKLFGVTDFETHEDESGEVDIKQLYMDKIKEILPEGIELVDIKL